MPPSVTSRKNVIIMSPTLNRNFSRTAAVGLLLALGLTGCSGSTGEPVSTATASASPERSMNEVLVGLYVPSGQQAGDQSAVGDCLVEALDGTQLSDAAREQLRTSDPAADLGDVITSMDQSTDREIMLSSSLRTSTDACLQKIVASNPTSTGTPAQPERASSSAPAAVARPAEPNLKPAFEIKDDEMIHDAHSLERGVVSMFGSFAADDAQKKLYEDSAQCLSQTIYGAGLSQEGLRFIAGGAPIGTGSIAEHLNDEDRAIWESGGFTDQMVMCTQRDGVETPAASATPGT